MYIYAHTARESVQHKCTPVCITKSYSQGALQKFTSAWGRRGIERTLKKYLAKTVFTNTAVNTVCDE